MTSVAKPEMSDPSSGTDGHPIPCDEPVTEPTLPPVEPKGTGESDGDAGDGGAGTEGHPRPARQS